MTPRKGQFQKGNPGGPGRPRKARPETEDDICPQILLRIGTEPPMPDEDCDFAEKFEYTSRLSEWIIYGYWLKKVSVPKKYVKLLLQKFKRERLRDPSYTMGKAYEAILQEMCGKWGLHMMGMEF